MNIWISILIAGIINYLTRLGSVLLIKPEKLNESTKKILGYVPSAVFPAIIFPAVFLNETNTIGYKRPKNNWICCCCYYWIFIQMYSPQLSQD